MKAIAIIADIIDSRTIEDRKLFQSQLKKTLASLSSRPSLASPYTITLGDEFQALYKTSHGIYADIFQILSRIRPVACRFSMGIGEITTRINKDNALGMDGPAFHLARDNLQGIKDSDSFFSIASPKASPALAMANDALRVFTHAMKTWPDSRYIIMADMLRGKSVEDIAERVDISPRAVYKSVQQGSLKNLISFFGNLEIVMDKILKDKEGA